MLSKMAPTKILVTGGNTGIGFEVVKALLQSSKPSRIFLGSRSLQNANDAITKLRQEVSSIANTVEPLQVDLDSDESIEKAYEQLKSDPGYLDTLVNNAGKLIRHHLDVYSQHADPSGASFDLAFLDGSISLRESMTRSYNINVAGTHVLTHTLIPLLKQSSEPRLIFISGLAAINQAAKNYFPTPPQPAGWPKNIPFETIGYRCSKVAMNMLMLDYNHKLKEDGVKVFAVGPGMNATSLGRSPERTKDMVAHLNHPSHGGQIIRSVVEGERDADVGKIVGKDGIVDW